MGFERDVGAIFANSFAGVGVIFFAILLQNSAILSQKLNKWGFVMIFSYHIMVSVRLDGY